MSDTTDPVAPVKKKYHQTKAVTTRGGFCHPKTRQKYERVIEVAEGDEVPAKDGAVSLTTTPAADDTPIYDWKEIED